MKKYHVLMLLWLIVSIYGVMMAFSANYINLIISGSGSNVYIKLFIQLAFVGCIALAGFIVFFKFKNIDWYGMIKRLATPMMLCADGMLILVYLFGVETVGAQMSIGIGPFNFQPLEMYKIAIILYLAATFSTVKPTDDYLDLAKKLILPGFGLILIFIQPDLGGVMIGVIVIFIMLVFNGQYIKQILISTLGLATVAIVGAGTLLHGYQMDRILNWINPFNDAQGGGYQLIQGYIAISNGGLLGKGYMNSIQKAGALSQAQSDFIFAVICEELGLIGAVFTIAILVALALVLFSIGNKAHERFGMLYCYGMGALLLTQMFVNIGGVTGIIPLTGVTLPFISKGINSYVFLTAGVFLAIPISQVSYREQRRERKTTNYKG